MPIKSNVRANMFNVINLGSSGKLIKPVLVYLAIRKHEKDVSFCFSLSEAVHSYAVHLPAFTHKEAWSYKYIFHELFEKCKKQEITNLRVYVANESVYAKMKEITNNLCRIARESNVVKLEIFFLKEGEYEAEYQIAENSIYRMNKSGLTELTQIKPSVNDFTLEIKHPKDYQAKLLFKKPQYVGKRHSEHSRERTVGVCHQTVTHSRNFKNVMTEMLEMGVGDKQKAKEALKYINEVLYRDTIGFVQIEPNTLQEWAMDWVQLLSLDNKEAISIFGLEDFLLNKVSSAKAVLDGRRKNHFTTVAEKAKQQDRLCCAV